MTWQVRTLKKAAKLLILKDMFRYIVLMRPTLYSYKVGLIRTLAERAY